VFDKKKFIKELNTESEQEQEETEKKTEIKPIQTETYNKQSYHNINDISFISKASRVSFGTKQPKRNNVSINNKSTIMDTIKNVQDAGSIDELKQKRSLIIIIRQYINTFEQELKNIYVVKSTFEKKLFIQSISQLQIILEDIRTTLSVSRNKEVFFNCIEAGLRGFETISNYSGYDITGVANELMNDPDFLIDLKILSCEIDISRYVNVKTSVFLKLIKKTYSKHQENNIKKQLDNVLNDKNKIDKILNLDKK